MHALCCVSFSTLIVMVDGVHFLVCFRFLADLMDSGDLIRNVVLCGHLHHGKVGNPQYMHVCC